MLSSHNAIEQGGASIPQCNEAGGASMDANPSENIINRRAVHILLECILVVDTFFLTAPRAFFVINAVDNV